MVVKRTGGAGGGRDGGSEEDMAVSGRIVEYSIFNKYKSRSLIRASAGQREMNRLSTV
jgi:hypothetical protein